MILGDVHGKWSHFRDLCEKEFPDLVIQVGDFGWWPELDYKAKVDGETYILSRIPTDMAEIRFCDGNHENHNSLYLIRSKNENKKEPIQIRKNLYYHPRGNVWIHPNGLKF